MQCSDLHHNGDGVKEPKVISLAADGDLRKQTSDTSSKTLSLLGSFTEGGGQIDGNFSSGFNVRKLARQEPPSAMQSSIWGESQNRKKEESHGSPARELNRSQAMSSDELKQLIHSPWSFPISPPQGLQSNSLQKGHVDGVFQQQQQQQQQNRQVWTNNNNHYYPCVQASTQYTST